MNRMVTLFIIALIMSVIRFQIPLHSFSPSGTYQALAHVFVGGLIGAWLVGRNKWYGLMALGLIIVELSAVFGRGTG